MINKIEIEGIEIGADEINASGFNIRYDAGGNGPILIGSVVGGSIVFGVYNKSGYERNAFKGKEIYLYIDGKRTGPFIAEEVMYSYDKQYISFEAYDKTRNMNSSFANSDVEFPNKAGYVLREVLKELNININNDDLDFLNSGLIINIEEEEKANYSYREIISSIVQISAGIGFIDPSTGTFKIKSILKGLSRPIKINENSIKSESISEDKEKTGVVYYKDIDDILLYGDIEDPIIIDKNPFINQLEDPDDFISYIGDMYEGKGLYNTGRVDIFEIEDLNNMISKDRVNGYFIGDTITDGNFRFIITSLTYSPGIIHLDSEGESSIDVDMHKVKELKKNYR